MATTAEEQAVAQGKTFVWHECYAPDAQKTIDFYTDALDFGSTEMPMGEMGSYKMLTKNGSPICGVLSTTEMKMDGVPPHWAVYIGVDNVDARLEKCISLGATVVMQAFDVPTVGRMALIADPQGAHVWIFQGADQG